MSWAASGAIASRIKPLQAATEQPPEEGPILVIGIGDAGCDALYAYEALRTFGALRVFQGCSWSQKGADLSVYANVQILPWRPAGFFGLAGVRDVESGLDTFHEFCSRLYERLDHLVDQCSAVIAVCSLEDSTGLSWLVLSNLSEIARIEQKRSVAIVSRPFSFERHRSAGAAHPASKRLRCQFETVYEVEVDAVLEGGESPLNLERPYSTPAMALASQMLHARWGSAAARVLLDAAHNA